MVLCDIFVASPWYSSVWPSWNWKNPYGKVCVMSYKLFGIITHSKKLLYFYIVNIVYFSLRAVANETGAFFFLINGEVFFF